MTRIGATATKAILDECKRTCKEVRSDGRGNDDRSESQSTTLIRFVLTSSA